MKQLNSILKRKKSLNIAKDKINRSLNFSNLLYVKLTNRPNGRERVILRSRKLPYGNWAKINICDFELFGCAQQSLVAITQSFINLK